jgi:hypothetical protein
LIIEKGAAAMTNVKTIHKGDKFWYIGQIAGGPIMGTVIALTSYAGKQIGLQFEVNISGHSCDGRGPEGFCLWARPSDILTDDEYKAKLAADAVADAANNAEDIEVLNLD